MASSPLDATPSNSIDVPGISITTAMPSASDLRAGSLYDYALSGFSPVYVTPMDEGQYLLLFNRRWQSGVPSTSTPGYYTSYSINDTPGWMLVNSSGTRSPVKDSYDIPMSTPYDTRFMTAACSRPLHFTYVLNTVTYNGITTAVLQNIFYNPPVKTIGTLAEETIPDGQLGGPPVGFVYNLPGIDNLILNADVTAKIFAGVITTWNHSAIAALNGGITLPSTAIKPIYCTGNPTTQTFQTWLTTTTWRRGSGTAYAGVGTSVSSLHEATLTVDSTEGAITYAEKPLATQCSSPVARFGSFPVRFDRGLFLLGSYLMVMGATDTGRVGMARKNWGRIGVTSTDWEYYTGTGWSTDPSEIQQATTTTGALTTVGPISAFSFEQNRIRMATVIANGTNRYAQTYSLTNRLDWKVAGSPIFLGSTADGSYQSGNIQFQPQLRVVDSLINTPDASTAIPYCFSKKVFLSGASALKVTWGAWQISRLY